MLGENFLGGVPTTRSKLLGVLVSPTAAEPEHDNSVQNRWNVAIEGTDGAVMAPKLRAASLRTVHC